MGIQNLFTGRGQAEARGAKPIVKYFDLYSIKFFVNNLLKLIQQYLNNILLLKLKIFKNIEMFLKILLQKFKKYCKFIAKI